ncbi:putative protein kinase YGL059W [Malassezia sp. CBS 17886]|nr:putative protein kinase YGL059W [Malassezia sp. CBS 17886]
MSLPMIRAGAQQVGVARRIARQGYRWAHSAAEVPISTPSTASGHEADAAALGRYFYRNRYVDQWGAIPAKRTTLQQIILFGQSARRNRKLLMESANYMRTELTTRIAHRLRDMQALPFVAMCNEQLDMIYQFYWNTFETLRRLDRIETREQNERLIAAVSQLLSERKSKLALIAGVSRECAQFMQPDMVDLFLARMLRSQISREVLARQHIALSYMHEHPAEFGGASTTIGMISTQLCVADAVHKCVELARTSIADLHGWLPTDSRIPAVVLDGDEDVHLAYLTAHLEFILLELCKVSMQSTMRFHREDPPPVRVTIVRGPDRQDMTIRISDEGGGLHERRPDSRAPSAESEAIRARGPLLLPGSDMPTQHAGTETSLVWSFLNIGEQLERTNTELDASALSSAATPSPAHLAAPPDPSAATPGSDGLMRLSVLNMDSKNGLPIVKLYADLFGGGLDFRTVDGYGTDIYLRLPKFGTSKEMHE